MSSSGAPQDNDWDVAALLAEPTRRQVLEAVRAATSPVTRDAVAEAVGIDRRLAAFHLDRLADGGLLAVSFARPAGRAGGPGAGRTAKHYQPTNQPLQLSVPPRRYELVARILALAVGRSPRAGQAEALVVAREEGERVGRRHLPRGRRTRAAVTSSACAALTELGYEPFADDGVVRLRNCPFREVAGLSREVVCSVNLALVEGMLDAAGTSDVLCAELDGTPPDCCVTVQAPRG